jgi:glycosyltransferase involved in cell wall biosynthesis
LIRAAPLVQRRRILLSAFACAPGWGSEPGVGWRWAQALAQRHDVTVLTHERFRDRIQAHQQHHDLQPHPGPTFVYLGQREPEAVMQRRVDSQLHYLLWQQRARPLVRRLLAEQPHDLIHHLTWGSLRLPTALAGLGLPLVVGPVGGGDDAPQAWMRSWPWAERLRYAARSAWIALGRIDPVARRALAGSTLILAKTEATRAALPGFAQGRTQLALEIGCPPVDDRATVRVRPPGQVLRLLYAGRLIGGKGVVYAVDAVLELARAGHPLTLDVVGEGRLEPWLRRRIVRSGGAASAAVRLHGARPHAAMGAAYRAADLLLFPSWHDSSGNVVAEALAHGLPVLCLDRAGPAALVDDRCAERIATTGLDEAGLVQALAARIAWLLEHPTRLQAMSAAALERAREIAWSAQIERACRLIEQRLGWSAAPPLCAGEAAATATPAPLPRPPPADPRGSTTAPPPLAGGSNRG